MIVLELNQVEVDYSPGCGGIWLDAGELELLLEGGCEMEQLMASLTKAEGVREKKKRCPICRKRMDKVTLGREQPVMIDSCPRKHGLWFDRGELRAVLEIGGLETDAGKRVLSLLSDIFRNGKK
jgi:Zn-finger nucleic acid-binding protein